MKSDRSLFLPSQIYPSEPELKTIRGKMQIKGALWQGEDQRVDAVSSREGSNWY